MFRTFAGTIEKKKLPTNISPNFFELTVIYFAEKFDSDAGEGNLFLAFHL